MAELKLLRDTALVTLVTSGPSVANNVRHAVDYDNSTELDIACEIYWTGQYGAAPTANTRVCDVYVLPGDGATAEVFPEGGDASTGTDDNPQQVFYVGSLETINPSTTADETLALGAVPLYGHGNRFVLQNVSGQTWDTTWTLKIKPVKGQTG